MGTFSNSVRSNTRNEERVEWDIGMNTILYFSASGVVYETRAYSTADIDQLVHDHGLQCLTSADRQFDFWFSPSARRCQRRANQSATGDHVFHGEERAAAPRLRRCRHA
jgi:hypothetical protein